MSRKRTTKGDHLTDTKSFFLYFREEKIIYYFFITSSWIPSMLSWMLLRHLTGRWPVLLLMCLQCLSAKKFMSCIALINVEIWNFVFVASCVQFLIVPTLLNFSELAHFSRSVFLLHSWLYDLYQLHGALECFYIFDGIFLWCIASFYESSTNPETSDTTQVVHRPRLFLPAK